MVFLFKQHSKILLLCFVVFIFGNLGQTYLISWWNPHLERSLGLSQTVIGLIYSVATLLSSFVLPLLGKAVDHLRPISFGIMISGALALGFSTLSLEAGVVGLFLAYFIIRLAGQVGLTLLSTTVLSRKFGQHRGKAQGMAQLGRPLGEAIFPAVVVWLLARFGGHQAALVVGLGFLALFIPILLWLAAKLNFDPLYPENEKIANASNTSLESTAKFSLRTFYCKHVLLVVVSNALIPFVFTGLFFQQAAFAEIKGWSPQTMAQGFTIYGLVGVASVLLSGLLVDRLTATRLLPVPMLPLLLALATLFWGEGDWACLVYLGFLAVAAGLANSLRGNFYAENFPLHQLGRIKGLDAGHMVQATAISPLLFSYCLDQKVPLSIMVGALSLIALVGFTCYLAASLHYLGHHKKHA